MPAGTGVDVVVFRNVQPNHLRTHCQVLMYWCLSSCFLRQAESGPPWQAACERPSSRQHPLFQAPSGARCPDAVMPCFKHDRPERGSESIGMWSKQHVHCCGPPPSAPFPPPRLSKCAVGSAAPMFTGSRGRSRCSNST